MMTFFIVMVKDSSSRYPDSYWTQQESANKRRDQLLEVFKAFNMGNHHASIHESHIEDATLAVDIGQISDVKQTPEALDARAGDALDQTA